MPHDVSCPAYYAILPIVPLVLITVFSFIPSINLDVVTANLLGLFFVFILELVRRRDRKEVTSDFSVVMKAMGNSFANVVSILIGAAVFAEAIKMLGGITIISNTLAAVKSAPIITMALMSMITFFAGMLLGSGKDVYKRQDQQGQDGGHQAHSQPADILIQGEHDRGQPLADG